MIRQAVDDKLFKYWFNRLPGRHPAGSGLAVRSRNGPPYSVLPASEGPRPPDRRAKIL